MYGLKVINSLFMKWTLRGLDLFLEQVARLPPLLGWIFFSYGQFGRQNVNLCRQRTVDCVRAWVVLV